MADSSSIVLITGANTGLGYEIVRALCSSGQSYRILLGGRSLQRAEAAAKKALDEFPQTPSRIEAVQIDIEDDKSIEALVQQVESQHGRLDVLVNNAGAQFDPNIKDGTMTMREVWTKSWTVNTVGTQLITTAFVPLLLKSQDPRLLFMASGLSSLAVAENLALPFNTVAAKGWPKPNTLQVNVPAYRSAKAGMNMMMREWYRMLKEDGVKVWCVSPGYLATGLGGNPEASKSQGALDPSIGGHFVKDVVEGKRDGDVGKVIVNQGVQPW